MRLLSAVCMITMLLSFSSNAQVLEKLWETDTVFKVPESVLYSKQHGLLFVSNIEGTQPWGKDGAGSIGKMRTNGEIIQAEWIRGFDAPKGMALRGNTLIVADLKTIKTVDIKKGKIIHTLEVEGAQTLNDVTMDEKGIVFVSDSRGKRVYRIEQNKADVFIDSTHGLRGPNGLLVHKGSLYVLDAGTLYRVQSDKSLQKLADGMEGGTDGIEAYSDDAFIVSCWGGVVYFVKTDGTKEKLLDTRKESINSADIGYNAAEKTIYVPTFWKNKIIAYRIQ